MNRFVTYKPTRFEWIFRIYCAMSLQYINKNNTAQCTWKQQNLLHEKCNSSILYRNLIHWHKNERAAMMSTFERRYQKVLLEKWFACIHAQILYWSSVCLVVFLVGSLVGCCSELLMQSNVYFYYHPYVSGAVVRMEITICN